MRYAWMKTVGAACALAALAVVPNASAASYEYAPNAEARNFNGGAGGWTLQTSHGGLCIPAITCYTAGAEHHGGGGPAGGADGFLQVDLFTIAEAVTDTTATLSSPPFRYKGAGGKEPKRLTFTLDRRTDIGGLLPAIDDSATYSVRLVQEGGGAALTLVDNQSIHGAEDTWTSIKPVELNPGDLKIGRRYRIEISTTFQSGITVIGTADIDYDNVVLRARGGGGGGGGNGNAGPGGGLTTGVRNSLGDAEHRGNKLSVPAGCPRNVAPSKCTLRVVAKLSKKGPKATTAGKLTVKPGGKKTAVLKVLPEYRETIAKRKRIVVRVKVRAGKKSRVVLKRVKVRHF